MVRVVVSRETHHLPSRGLRKPAVTQPANGREDVFRAEAETGDSEARAVLRASDARPPGRRGNVAGQLAAPRRPSPAPLARRLTENGAKRGKKRLASPMALR